MSIDHGPDCYACTDPVGAARQIAAERAELDAWAERGRRRRAEGERAREASLKLLVAGDRDGADREEARMLHELRAANAIACDIRFRRAHLNRVEEAHPAVRDRLEVGQ
jgi:hypothetical protein